MANIIEVRYPKPEIAVVHMQDEAGKNLFTDEFGNALITAFADIEQNTNVKVIITTGYGNYYASGGSLEELKSLAIGEKTFVDLDFFILPFSCSVPTIAAIQGHAIGGGLAYGCLHDFMICSRSAMYSANFMKYGFTPGMCSTYMVPLRFGRECGRQMLFTADMLSSKELQAMGCQIAFHPKKEVMDIAMSVAEKLCEKPMKSLKLLKQHLNDDLKKILPEVMKLEVEMHHQTLTPEVIKRIEDKFDEI